MSAEPDRSNLPWWKREGLVLAGGWHPLAARLRCEIQYEDVESDYDWEYTEEHVRTLKDHGITVVIGQFDRGLGESDQAPQQERARQLAALCHRHGLYHGVYLPNTIYYESMRKDHPQCADWALRTWDGRFAYYGGQQTFRWIVCFMNPGWRQRMREQIRRAIEVVGTDLLHFDNLGVWPEPDSCHCDHCREAFRRFLLERYPDEASQQRRFGYSGVETFDPPTFNMSFSPPWSFDRLTNPLLQEWVDFRCWSVTDYIRDLAGYARSLKADICIDSNGQSVRGENQAILHGTDQAAQAAHVDIVWDENPDYRAPDPMDPTPDIDPLERKFRGMNMLRSLGKQVLTAYRDQASLAFNLAFAGDPGINEQWGYAEPGRMPQRPAQEGVAELLAHHRRHRHLYTDVRPAARVGLWRQQRSLAWINSDTHLSACVLEQVLFNHRVPFQIVCDHAITKLTLEKLDLLILPNVEFLSDDDMATLLAWVEQGGALLITEQTGCCTSEPRRRRQPAFARFFPDDTRMATHGRGRLAWLDRIDYVHRPGTFRSGYCTHYDGIDSRYWRMPGNVQAILDLVHSLAPQGQLLRIDGHPHLRMDLVRWGECDRRLGLMLLRLGENADPVDLLLRRDNPPPSNTSLALYHPHLEDSLSLTWSNGPEGWHTHVPAMRRHAVLVETFA